MKSGILIVAVLILGLTDAEGQKSDTLRRTNYGIELNQFITGSGFASGTEILVSVVEGRRNFNIGLYYCSEARRITGIIAHHEVSLLRQYNIRRIKPYFFYNGIARITKIEQPLPDNINITRQGIYKTFEHHFGIGIRTSISRNTYFSSLIGYGIYFGSIKKPISVEGTEEIAGSNGFSPIAKLGIGIIL